MTKAMPIIAVALFVAFAATGHASEDQPQQSCFDYEAKRAQMSKLLAECRDEDKKNQDPAKDNIEKCVMKKKGVADENGSFSFEKYVTQMMQFVTSKQQEAESALKTCQSDETQTKMVMCAWSKIAQLCPPPKGTHDTPTSE